MIKINRVDNIEDECSIWITLTSNNESLLNEINELLKNKNFSTDIGFVKKSNHFYLDINELDILEEFQVEDLIKLLNFEENIFKAKILRISCISDFDNFDFDIPIHVFEIAYKLKLKTWLSYSG